MNDTPPIPHHNDFIARIMLAERGTARLPAIDRVENAGGFEETESGICQVMFNGVRVGANAYHGNWTRELIRRCQGHHEPQEELAFATVLATLPAGARMIELGCNWAFYSAWFMSSVPGGEARLLEPHPDGITAALQTLSLNRLSAPLDFAYAGQPPDRHVFYAVGHFGQAEFRPPVRQVDEILARAGWDGLDILHSDIQGAELAMLNGAREALAARRIGYLFVSTHSDALHADCLACLQKAGYRILCEHDQAQSFSFDGLIVAASPDRTDIETIDIPIRTVEDWTWEEAVASMEAYLARVQEGK